MKFKMRNCKWLVLLLPGVALLMAPTGGYPSRPNFQAVTITSKSTGFPAQIIAANSSTGSALRLTGSFTGAGQTNLFTVQDVNNTNGANIQLIGNGGQPNKFIRSAGGNFQILNSGYSASLLSITDAGNITVPAPSSGTALALTGTATNALVLDASGGPSSGYSTFTGNLTVGTSGGDYPFVGYNAVPTTTVGLANYKLTDFASRIKFGSGGIQFQTAASGTAANPITFATPLAITQAGAVTVNGANVVTSTVTTVSGTISAGCTTTPAISNVKFHQIGNVVSVRIAGLVTVTIANPFPPAVATAALGPCLNTSVTAVCTYTFPTAGTTINVTIVPQNTFSGNVGTGQNGGPIDVTYSTD
jgi:hypothetical protein